MAVEAAAPQAILEPPAEAGPSGGDVVMILDEDPVPPPLSGGHDAMMTPASEPTPAVAVADPSLAVEVPEPSPTVEMLEPSSAEGAAGTSSAVIAVTIKEVMELATSRYIDFPGVGIIDLEAPQLPEKVLEVATERMFVEPSIMETIALVSKALHEYERVGDFALVVSTEATDGALEALVASMGPIADAGATTAVAATGAAEAVVREVGSSPPRPVAAGADEVRALDKPAAAVQERVAPKTMTRAASPEIQEAEETGASLSQPQQAVMLGPSSLPAPRGRPPSGMAMTPRTTRRLPRATPWCVG
jgi:hypothetical protein